MPRKKLSHTKHSFVFHARAALRLTCKRLADELGLKQPTISGYQRGNPLPQETYLKIRQMLLARHAWLKTQNCPDLKDPMDIHNMNVQQNLLDMAQGQKPGEHYQSGRLLRRSDTPSTERFPAYCLTRARWEVYVLALSAQRKHVLWKQQHHTLALCQRDYRIDLANLKALAENLPRSLPYNVRLRHTDWPTVSSALRHLGTLPALALYDHWKKHRFSGFPVNRSNNKR